MKWTPADPAASAAEQERLRDDLPDVWRIVSRTPCSGGGHGVVACGRIPAGHVVARCEVRSLQPWRDERSIEMLAGVHVHTEVPGCVFNHSCQPNLGISAQWPSRAAGIERAALVWTALREIREDEELTWHYGTAEAYSISVAACQCGHCDGRRVRGFRELPPGERERLSNQLGVLEHLQ